MEIFMPLEPSQKMTIVVDELWDQVFEWRLRWWVRGRVVVEVIVGLDWMARLQGDGICSAHHISSSSWEVEGAIERKPTIHPALKYIRSL